MRVSVRTWAAAGVVDDVYLVLLELGAMVPVDFLDRRSACREIRCGLRDGSAVLYEESDRRVLYRVIRDSSHTGGFASRSQGLSGGQAWLSRVSGMLNDICAAEDPLPAS